MTAERGRCGKLLIVDDDDINLAILENVFAPDFSVETAYNGRQALDIVYSGQEDICAVLLDVVMPEMDGLSALRELHARGLTDRLPVFIITAEASGEVLREAYSLGVMDVISKPVVPFVVRRRVQSVIELFQSRRQLRSTVLSQHEELLAQAQQIIELNQGMVEALATAIEFRSEESGGHVRRIHDITRCLLAETPYGDGLGGEQTALIALASILHDVGKIAVPDAILNKPGRLTAEEFEVMKTHTIQGAALLEKIPQLRRHAAFRYAVDIARHHHERWDGRGYPDGLRAGEITPWAHAVALADVYDALSCKRVYKDAFPRQRVLEMIRAGECGVFDPKLLDCFFSVEGKLSQMYRKEAMA